MPWIRQRHRRVLDHAPGEDHVRAGRAAELWQAARARPAARGGRVAGRHERRVLRAPRARLRDEGARPTGSPWRSSPPRQARRLGRPSTCSRAGRRPPTRPSDACPRDPGATQTREDHADVPRDDPCPEAGQRRHDAGAGPGRLPGHARGDRHRRRDRAARRLPARGHGRRLRHAARAARGPRRARHRHAGVVAARRRARPPALKRRRPRPADRPGHHRPRDQVRQDRRRSSALGTSSTASARSRSRSSRIASRRASTSSTSRRETTRPRRSTRWTQVRGEPDPELLSMQTYPKVVDNS